VIRCIIAAFESKAVGRTSTLNVVVPSCQKPTEIRSGAMIVTELIITDEARSLEIRRSPAVEDFFVVDLFQPSVRSPLSDNFHNLFL
jgi:hypothetical protein